MDNDIRAALAVGIGAGYVAGRTNRGRLALALVSLAAGRALDPVDLVGRGARVLLDQARARSLEGKKPPEGTMGDGADDAVDEIDQGGGIEERGNGSPEHAIGRHVPGKATTDEDEEVPPSSEPPPRRRKQTDGPSSRKPGPRNPPAEKARSLARKRRAERSEREAGPRNPPAAKARARKRADRSARKPGPENPPAAKAVEAARKRRRQTSSDGSSGAGLSGR